MNRILLKLVTIALLTALAGSIQAGEKPNVLFIFMDDYGWRDCGFMGSDFYETPNIDALAKRGMVFSDAYSTAANCAPARACLLSGQYTPRHEIYNVGTTRRGKKQFGGLKHVPGTDTLRRDIRTWAHCVQDAGYRTATIGKWHLSDDPLPYGFDFNFAGTHSGSPPRGYFPPHPKAPGLEDAPNDEYLTDRLADETIKFINRSGDDPWFVYLTHFAVHTPLQGKQELVDRFKKKPKGDLHDSAVMAAMIQSVDEGVGRIVSHLNDTGQLENTIIVFTSDNGGHGPVTNMHPLKGYKGTYYEGGIREPFFVVWPGVVKPESQCSVPTINVDLFPTFCEMTGTALPSQPLDGVSIVPLLKGQPIAERSLFWHFPAYLQSTQRIDGQRDPIYRSRPCSIIRSGDWKLHEYFEDDHFELYDLKNDPGESINLAESKPEVQNRLEQELVLWRESIKAPVPTELNPHYDAVAEQQAIAKKRKRK